MSNSNLFEANLLRFVAISSAKLFEHAMREDAENYMNSDHVEFLYQALQNAEKALKIYMTEHIPSHERQSN